MTGWDAPAGGESLREFAEGDTRPRGIRTNALLANNGRRIAGAEPCRKPRQPCALRLALADRDDAARLKACSAITTCAAFAHHKSDHRPDAQRVELTADDAAAVKIDLPPVIGPDVAAILSWEEAFDGAPQRQRFAIFHGSVPSANPGFAKLAAD